jgi:DNA mismatch repair protein MutS
MKNQSTDLQLTPMMAQWHQCKEQAKDALLLFRLGDFYEAFYQDAHTLSEVLELTLTRRCDAPMSGIPAHASENYIDRLLARGFKVAIAEQIENGTVPSTNGIVKRAVVKVLTPGTLIHSALLKEKCPNYLGAVQKLNSIFGFALLDISTGDFFTMELESLEALQDELSTTQPKELLIPTKCAAEILFSGARTLLEEWQFDHRAAVDMLKKHFHIHSPDSFGLKGMPAAINSAAVLLKHVSEELGLAIDHVETLRTRSQKEYLQLDRTALKHLEILESLNDHSPSLLSYLDRTTTPMGGRLLQDWLLHPLLSPSMIAARQTAVAELIQHKLAPLLQQVRDIERLLLRIATGGGGPRDLLSLRASLHAILPIKALLSDMDSSLIQEYREKLADLSPLIQRIDATLSDSPPHHLSEGGAIRHGFNRELDALRELQSSGQKWVEEYQQSLREQTGIKTLKVGFTKSFGYYIEVSRGQAKNVPDLFRRQQTLINSERFFSPELKEYEQKIYSSENRIQHLEAEIFADLKEECRTHGRAIRETARAIGALDVLNSFALSATHHRYIRPQVDEIDRLVIEEGKHPIIAAALPLGEFTPNDVKLDAETHFHLITGPNMAGKSTFIRQVALLVIMAQIGSFIPAKSAEIGIVDKVFSRIGASDDLSRGQSTFMVEMSETASILHNVTDRSLVILDEIGRGTSTYDGIAIAWAVTEYLLKTPGKRPKTLFATHYWELNALDKIPGLANFQVSIAESPEGIIFLRKIIPGTANRSYGIHVAQLAGLPNSLLARAREILASLERGENEHLMAQQPLIAAPLLPAAQRADEAFILAQLRNCQTDHLTPIEALQTLIAWKERIAQ